MTLPLRSCTRISTVRWKTRPAVPLPHFRCRDGGVRTYFVLKTHINPSASSPTLPSIPASTSPSHITILCLVTPTYASLFNTNSETLQTLSKSSSLQNSASVQVVGAVVDALPSSSLSTIRQSGWSIMVTDEPVTVSEPTSTSSTSLKMPSWFKGQVGGTAFNSGPEDQANRMDEKVGSLAINFPTTASVIGQVGEFLGTNHLNTNSSTLSVKFPLANTLFETGSWSTISYRSSIPNDTIPPSPGSLTIALPPSSPFTPKISLPLKPLTSPRIVHSGNGNILTKLVIPPTSDLAASHKPFPASHELEQAVTTHLNSHPPSTPVIIFARITTDEPNLQSTIGTSLLGEGHGERIRRVLSGGGGWGKKAGLLALDPQGAEGFHISEAAGKTEVGTGKGLVEWGDWIQFFIAVPGGGKSDDGVGKGWVFGGVDKVDDEARVDIGEEDGKEEVIDGTFGAVAEGGFWVESHKVDVPGGQLVLKKDSED